MDQHRRRPSEGVFGIDHPFALAQWRGPVGESRGIGKRGVLAEELQLTQAMRLAEFFKEAPSKQPR